MGRGISGRVRALNLTVPLGSGRVGSGRVGSDDLGYGPGSGFSFEPVQTSKLRPPTRAGQLDARLETNHLKKSKTGPKRNITEQRIQRLQMRRSFPVTSRGSSSDTTCFQPRAARRNTNWPRDTRNEEPNQHVELTRENETKHPACLNQQKQVTN